MCGFSIILILKEIMTFQSQRVHAVCAIQLNKSLIINIAWLDLLINYRLVQDDFVSALQTSFSTKEATHAQSGCFLLFI